MVKSNANFGKKSRAKFEQLVQMARLRAEKCELYESEMAYAMALKHARTHRDLSGVMESIAGLLRLSAEALNEVAVKKWESELDSWMAKYPKQIPANAWYCKGAVARHFDREREAQKYFLLSLKMLRKEAKSSERDEQEQDELVSRSWLTLAYVSIDLNHMKRADWLAHRLLRTYGEKNVKNVRGSAYLILALIHTRKKNFDSALQYLQKAHGAFLAEHNWFYHLYVLLAYARIYRIQQNYSQAYLYLDLVEKATQGAQFGSIRREVATERDRLEKDTEDLLIDSRQGLVKTRSGGEVAIGNQHILLSILEALSEAHRRDGADLDRGLSKAEIIEKVWQESYRPEAHDNKLYYNINRLRKLIEPDLKKPQYLINWREGYRLAPGLRVQFVGVRKEVQLTGETV